MQLVNVEIKESDHGVRRYAHFKDLKTNSDVTLDFGTLLVTPEHQPRALYNNSGLTDENVKKKNLFFRVL